MIYYRINADLQEWVLEVIVTATKGVSDEVPFVE